MTHEQKIAHLQQVNACLVQTIENMIAAEKIRAEQQREIIQYRLKRVKGEKNKVIPFYPQYRQAVNVLK